MKQFRIRCSAIGQIMTNARSKTEVLGKTAKTYLEDWKKEQIYSRRKEFTNKYVQKGNDVEDESIEYIAEHLDYGFLAKNTKYYENDFLTGTPDIVLKDTVIDVKNSYDCFTFPLFEKDLPTKAYYWQLQGYMALTGRKKAILIYTLMNTPFDLINREFEYSQSELEFSEFEKKFIYDDIDPKYRIKQFYIERNDEDISKIYERVEECRTYIKTLN